MVNNGDSNQPTNQGVFTSLNKKILWNSLRAVNYNIYSFGMISNSNLIECHKKTTNKNNTFDFSIILIRNKLETTKDNNVIW